jgi:hypothetical protein
MEPLDGTAKWVESGPDLLSNDPDMAGLMVRIGMAVNALTVHLRLAYRASQQKADAVRQRDNLVSLVLTASLTFEALQLAHKNQNRLRPLLQRLGDKDDLLSRVGRLLSGTHPAFGLLERARNSLGFHWDYKDEYIGAIVNDFTKNEKIIWVEEAPPPEPDTVHRLSFEVLARAILPDVGKHSDPTTQRQVMDAAFREVIDALNTLAEYFTVAVVAYLREQGVSTARSR